MNSKLKTKNSTLPFVLINMAMTADGKIATANRAVSSFGSPRDHDHLLTLRATADAVMCGARTADLNQINLGPGAKKFRQQRLKHGLAEYNLRIIVTGSGTLNPCAEIFRHNFSPILILTTRRATAAKLKKLRALATEVKICGAHEINWPRTLSWLRKKWNVKRLLCEGGGELNDALFRVRLVDELHLTVCPKIFGGRRAPTIAEGIGFGKLSATENFELKSARRAADEIFLTFVKRPPATRNCPA